MFVTSVSLSKLVKLFISDRVCNLVLASGLNKMIISCSIYGNKYMVITFLLLYIANLLT